jgi:hypothetical protein
MSDQYEVRKGEGELMPALAYTFRKAPRGPTGLTSPSDCYEQYIFLHMMPIVEGFGI